MFASPTTILIRTPRPFEGTRRGASQKVSNIPGLLMIASIAINLKVAEIPLSYGMNVNTSTEQDALSFVLLYDQLEAAKMLIQRC